jgi:hypothetical protein
MKFVIKDIIIEKKNVKKQIFRKRFDKKRTEYWY